MIFLKKLRDYRLEQRKAGNWELGNFYYSDIELPDIINTMTSFFSKAQKDKMDVDMTDVEEMREYIRGSTLIGYTLKPKSEKYSVENRPMYYGV